jgi:hypothetical protein
MPKHPRSPARPAIGRRLAAGLWLVFASLLWASAARADDPDFLHFALGAFDVQDQDATVEARLEYRSRHKFLFLKPFAGVMVNGDGGGHVYGGVLLDVFWGKRWVTTLSLAPGGYFQGGGKDLGSAIEVRSGIELAYRFDNRARLGVALNHISHSVVSSAERNPGAESLMLFYALLLDRLFGP